jgi:hypothetical protein
MPSRWATPETRLRITEARRCNVTGCPEQRHIWGAYCRQHQRKRYRHGHPLALSIDPKEYGVERQEVGELFDWNAEHPGLKAAQGFLQKLIEHATTQTNRAAVSRRGRGAA